MLRSNELAPHVMPSLSLPHPAPGAGALLVAWCLEEHRQLADVRAKAAANFCTTHLLSANELYEREPALQPGQYHSSAILLTSFSETLPSHTACRPHTQCMPTRLHAGALGALHIPGERVIDSYDLVHAYVAHARANGGVIRENCLAVGGTVTDEGQRHWRVHVQDLNGQCDCICARAVINAAGLHGDSVDQSFLKSVSFNIIPRKGEFVVLKGCSLQHPLRHIVLPFPSQRTKGVLLTPTLSGDLLIGPTAVDVSERDARAARCDDSASVHLLKFARQKLKLVSESMATTYAGLRPATQHQDYVIEAHDDRLWVTVAGIRSTGVSASLGIAEYTVQLLQRILGPLQVSSAVAAACLARTPCHSSSFNLNSSAEACDAPFTNPRRWLHTLPSGSRTSPSPRPVAPRQCKRTKQAVVTAVYCNHLRHQARTILSMTSRPNFSTCALVWSTGSQRSATYTLRPLASSTE